MDMGGEEGMVSSAGFQSRYSSADISHRAGMASFYFFVNNTSSHTITADMDSTGNWNQGDVCIRLINAPLFLLDRVYRFCLNIASYFQCICSNLYRGPLAVAVILLSLLDVASAQVVAANKESGLSGQWYLELCDKKVSDQCGGFAVYLVQIGNKLCGDHFFATPGLGRLNEGAPRSITGTVTNNVADIVITSGRNGAVFRVRAIQNNDILDWKIVEEIKRGPEGDSALVLEKGKLKREAKDSGFQAVFSACEDQ
jgi:hypothetical protein